MKKSIFVVAGVAVNGLNYLFHLMTARGLSNADYGALGALFGLFMVTAVFAIGLQTTTARAVAKGDSARGFAAWGWILGIALGVIAIVLHQFYAPWLNLPNGRWALAFAIALAVMLVEAVHRGRLQGEEKWGWLSASMLADAGGKVALWIAFSHFGFDGAVWALLGASVLSLPFGWVNPLWQWTPVYPILSVALAQLGLIGFMALDVPYVSATLPEASGEYNATAKVAGLLYMLGSLAVTLWYTGAAAGAARKAIVHFAWFGFACGAAVLLAFPIQIITFLFSADYAPGAAYMPALVGLSGALLWLSFGLHARWARHDHAADFIAVAAVCVWAGVTWWAGLAVSQMVFVAGACAFVAGATTRLLPTKTMSDPK